MADGTPDLSRLDPDTWRRIESVLDEVIDAPPERVPELLDRLCAGDPTSRSLVEAIVRTDAWAEGFLTGSWRLPESPVSPEETRTASATSPEAPDAWLAGRMVGPWRLRHEIGRGGMSVVYLAARADGQFEQEVAVKLLGIGPLGASSLARFKQERQVLARLEHPNIARLVDAGVTDDGLWWFALEYVAGSPITEHCERKRLGLEATLDLFLQSTRAVQYAHRNLVIHRDLKPSNIFVSERGEAKLLDFGVAKLLDPALAADQRTLGFLQPLTPSYAAPEQLAGETPTTATDVYALGIVLYELLTGSRPFAGVSLEESRRASLEREPSPPSVRLRGEKQGRRSGWERRVRGDLDNIVLTALRKEPDRRYPSVEAFAEDLRRWREGRPVKATGPSLRYVAGKFVRRNRVPVAAAAMVVVALAGGLAAAVWQARVATRERDSSRREAAKAEEMKNFLLGLFDAASPEESRGTAITAPELLDRGAERITRELRHQPIAEAEMLEMLADVYDRLGDYPKSVRLRETALRELEPARPGADTLVANILHTLGSAYFDNGQRASADSALELAVSMQRRLRGPVAVPLAAAMADLAELREYQGRLAEAESLFRETLRIDSLALGMESTNTATDVANMGLLLGRLGRVDEEVLYLDRSLAIRSKAYGPGDLRTALALVQSGVAYRDAGRLEKAESLHVAALAIRARQLPPDHRDLGYSYRNLGDIAMDKGDLPVAIERDREALRIFQHSLSPSDPVVAEENNQLAVAFYRSGQLDSALTHMRSAYRIWQAALPPTHRDVLTCRTSVGAILRDLGRYPEAETWIHGAMAVRERTLPSDDLDLATSYFHYGKLLALRGQRRDGKQYLEKALAIRLKKLPPDHPEVIKVKTALDALNASR